MSQTLNASYWNERYAQSQTGWDIGYASPAIVGFAMGLPDKNQRVLIPGCGNAYEAEFLIQHGFTNITLIDIAPLVVEAIRKRLVIPIEQGTLRVIQGDFFELNEVFDVILEQTFFCALPPSMRAQYAQHVHTLLAANGMLAGVLFNFPLTDEGPPFGGSIEEYRQYFSPLFEIEKLELCYNSIKPRADRELFIRFVKSTHLTGE